MTSSQFVAKLKNIVDSHKTLYVMGCFGAPLKGDAVSRYCNNCDYNRQPERTALINKAANQNPPVFGFDCVCLIKGVLWGWNGDADKLYGGAKYESNGVPDISANTMIQRCKEVSSDFSGIVPGEAVWMKDHIGVYIGNGKVIESSPIWNDGVQITNFLNNGVHGRKWTKHGKLPYITYDM